MPSPIATVCSLAKSIANMLQNSDRLDGTGLASTLTPRFQSVAIRRLLHCSYRFSFLATKKLVAIQLISCSGTLPLHEILVCLSIKKSLLSVSKLCDDYPCAFYFDANKVCMIDLWTQKVVSKGPRNNGLYMLKNRDCEDCYSGRQTAASEATLHHRLAIQTSRFFNNFNSVRISA